MRRLAGWLQWLWPPWWLQVVLWSRLSARVAELGGECAPGSWEQAEWLAVGERLRADLDGYRWGRPGRSRTI